ncbi:MotA/TolQ/ExbB proton channel family protein, partial [Vibrio sp. Y176]|nr:MotA/TolQ/ExbB proton channel family protein [Vibrio sp. Y176]
VLAKLEHTLNYVNLWLEGISLQHVSPEKTKTTASITKTAEAKAS